MTLKVKIAKTATKKTEKYQVPNNLDIMNAICWTKEALRPFTQSVKEELSELKILDTPNIQTASMK